MQLKGWWLVTPPAPGRRKQHKITAVQLHYRQFQHRLSALCFSLPQKQTPDQLTRVGGLGKELDDDLLSHGETPHYHRRCVVSLLSSGRDQVVPTLYGRQAIQLLPRGLAAAANRVCDESVLRVRADFRSVCRLSV